MCGFIPEDECLVLVELSYFFCVLCAKEVSPTVIDDMEKQAPELLCKLEKIFPPGVEESDEQKMYTMVNTERVHGRE